MAYRDLQKFMEKLDSLGELIRIDETVSSDLEITEIADRVSKENGPGLLFSSVKDKDYPLLINAMGSFERMSLALGAKNLDAIGDEIEAYLNLSNYMSIKGLWKSKRRLFRLLTVFPIKTMGKAMCQQIVEREPDLSRLPVLKCWPEDAAPFVTLPLVFTKDRETKQQNVGMYRLQILNKNTTGMHWHKHKDGSEIFNGYKKCGEKMPVSVALGCDPAITYAATAPLPKQIDEIMFAGWLRKKNVRMVKSLTNDIYIPANAEIVLEGYVDPKEDLVLEGPFGDHTGYYSLADYYPRFHVTCITHRKNAVYPATIVGKPPMEDCYMAKATERIFLPVLKMQIPEMKDLNLPLEGVFHNCAIISVVNRYPGCAAKVMNAVWGMGQMMYTKMILIVDESVDVQDLTAVWRAVSNYVRGEEDFVFSQGPLDALDHSSNQALYGTRVGMDATMKNTELQEKNYLILSISKDHAFQGRDLLLSKLPLTEVKFLVVVDSEVDCQDIKTVLWKVFNNIDGKRDIVFHGDKIGMDATKKWKEEGIKREWPNDIVMSKEIKDFVSEKWKQYGIS